VTTRGEIRTRGASARLPGQGGVSTVGRLNKEAPLTPPTRFLCLVAAVALAACRPSINTRRALLDEVVDTEPSRRDTFEATLRVLDEHPEYIDELFKLMLEHPTTLNRFLAINASGLDDAQYAALMARHLVRHPEPLTEVMVQVLIAAKDKPEAQQAMALAMEKQPRLNAEALTSRSTAVSASTRALLEALLARPEARGAYLAVLRERKEQVAELLLSDAETMAALMGALAEQGVEDSALADQLRSLVEGLTGRGGSGPPPPQQQTPPPPKQ
jgi:uncharacterized coiled-coil protein SlyX